MIKWLLTNLTLILVLPFVWLVRASRGDKHRCQARFRSCSELLSVMPFQLGMLMRRLYYERTLARCGHNLMVFFGAAFLNPDARVGSDVEIRPHCMVGLADIGDHVSLAQRVSVLSGRHQHQVDAQRTAQERLPPQRVRIRDGAWIGAHAVVMNDVGERSVIGAGAVVVNPIPSHSVAVGVPARVAKQYESDRE